MTPQPLKISLTQTNSQYDWDQFNTEAYYRQYTAGVIWEDRCLGRFVAGALLELGVPLKSLSLGIDACNGGVLRGPMMIAPFIKDGGRLHWSDYGAPQLASAKAVIKRGKQGNLGSWAAHQTHFGECHPAWSDAGLRACRLGESVKQTIFELPKNTYDIGITCFGPESLTGDYAEWERAVAAFFGAVKAGHPAIMLYMVNSSGYGSAGQAFPATPIENNDVLRVAGQYLNKTQLFFVSASHDARPKDDPFGYDGMGAIVGLRT